MEQTPNLRLPYLMPAQAQKHVTHNEALRALDAIVQVGVIDRDLAAPPGSPAEGARYIVAAGGTGAWAGQSGNIAAWQDGAWAFYAPASGWLVWVADESRLLAWDGTAWVAAGGSSINPASMVGVNTTADTTNRLAVKSDAVLLSHDDVTPGTGSLRVVVNKKLAADTCSFLFQTNFSGRAEFGLAGDDKWRVKVSPDGSSWREPLVIDPATGKIGINTATPDAALTILSDTIAGNAGEPAVLLLGSQNKERFEVRTNNNPAFQGRCFGGTLASPTATPNGAALFVLLGGGYDGTQFPLPFPAAFGFNAAEQHSATGHGTFIRFFTTPIGSTGAGRLPRFVIEADGTVNPGADNVQSLGSSVSRWSSIWAANGTIQTSDARDKDVTARIPGTTAAGAVDAIEPVMFRWRVGGYDMVPSPTETVEADGVVVPKMVPVAKPGNRMHAGFLAQEVKAAMDAAGVDFGVWGLDDVNDPDSRQWLRPDQMIPVLWAALRQTRAELAAVRSSISS